MNDMAFRCEHSIADAGGLARTDLAELNRSLRRNINSARGYCPPIELAAKRLARIWFRLHHGAPFVMRRESGLDLRLLQGFPRSVPLHGPEPPQLRERDDGGGLPVQVDHLQVVQVDHLQVGAAAHVVICQGQGVRSSGCPAPPAAAV